METADDITEDDYNAIIIQHAWLNSKTYRVKKIKAINNLIMKSSDNIILRIKQIDKLNSNIKYLLQIRENYLL